MNKFLILSLVLSSAAGAFAQSPDNPLITAEKGIYSMISNSAIRAAEKMPEADYSFKPTPDVRSFAQLVGHEADGQYEFCSVVLGDQRPPSIEKSKTSKADLVQALKDAVSYCDKAFAGLTDAQAAESVKFFGRTLPKLSIFSFNSAHTDEHYGNMATYLRLKNIVPPTSEPHGK